MKKFRDNPPAVRVYTVCDESKYLIVRNVPSLGCGDEILKLFSSYGLVEQCKPMDAEDCEAYTDVYWLKFNQINNARFAKKKLDDTVFLGNRLQVSYASEFETLSDTKEKLEGRRKEVLGRLNPKTLIGPSDLTYGPRTENAVRVVPSVSQRQPIQSQKQPSSSPVSSDKMEYFPLESMNRTVHLVRDKLNNIQSIGGEHVQAGSSKRPRTEGRRRI